MFDFGNEIWLKVADSGAMIKVKKSIKSIGLYDPDEVERKTHQILRTLCNSPDPLGSRVISRKLSELGINLSERTIRYHLRIADERGLTRLVGRRDGRTITPKGVEEIKNARVQDKIGFVISRIENLAFRTTFDPVSRQGLLPVNISFFEKDQFGQALELMRPVFKSCFSVSGLVCAAEEGQRIGESVVPPGKVALATVCSIVVNGVFLKSGIPMDSRFGAILETVSFNPLRFVELIFYNGSSLDPSEAFIRANMTSVGKAVETGNGNVLANYREIPGICGELARNILDQLKGAGIYGVFAFGEKSESVCHIPVDVNKIGLILLGGLNPIACAQEAGIKAEHHAMSSLLEYRNFINIDDLKMN